MQGVRRSAGELDRLTRHDVSKLPVEAGAGRCTLPGLAVLEGVSLCDSGGPLRLQAMRAETPATAFWILISGLRLFLHGAENVQGH